MSNAKKCDRCGVFYEIKEPNKLQELAQALTFNMSFACIAPTIHRDLCQDCEKSFEDWWFRRVDNEQREAD